jgi:hypothetical protein
VYLLYALACDGPNKPAKRRWNMAENPGFVAKRGGYGG